MANSSSDRAVIDLVINGQQAQTSLKQVSLEVTRATAAIVKMKETDAGYNDKLKELHALLAAQRQMRAQINDTTTAWGRFKSNVASTAVGVLGGNVLETALSAAGNAITGVIGKFREFDAASRDLSAVTGATGRDLEYLNKTAARTGPDFGKSGAEMLEAYKLMASAKPELLEQKELLTETTKAAITLSQAGKIDLAEATKVTAESLNQFGESADQANRYVNVIAAGAKEGSAEINEMGAALKNSGTVAKAQGVTFEQTNAILQSMSTIALKGGEAGTGLRNVLLTLGAGSDDTNPKVVGLEKALENLGKKNLSTAEMTKLFGKENITAAQHIITHRGEIGELTKKITGTQEAFSQAEKNNKSLDHQLEVFWARVSGLGVLLGTYLVPAFTKVVDVATGLTKFLTSGLTPASEKATQAFEDQRTKVSELTKNFAPLLARHDELRRKTILTKDEQAELKSIVAQVANVVPSAVTEFDKYGNALSINTQKARDFIRMQQELLKFQNKKAIEETTGDLTDKTRERDATLARLRVGTVTENTGMGVYRTRQLSEEERRAMQEKMATLNDDIAGLEARKKGLTGDYMNAPASASPTLAKPKAEPTGGSGGPTDKEKKAAEAQVTANEMAKLAIEQRNIKAIKDEQARELAQAQYEANQELERARKSKATGALKSTWIKGIEDALLTEKLKIEEKYTAKKNEETEKQMAAKRKAAEEELELEKAKQLAMVQIMVANGDLSKETGDQAKLMAEETFLEAKLLLNEAHYGALADLYQADKDKLTQITLDKKNAINRLTGEITDNEADQSTARKAISDAELKGNRDANKLQEQDNKNLYQAKKKIFDESVVVLKGFFKENTIAYKAAFIAQQAWALGEVAINYSRAVMAGIASASGIPFPGNLLAIAKAIALPTLESAAAVANIRSQKFAAPAFADGGFTGLSDGPSGFVSNPTLFTMGKRSFIAGEAGREFVISNKALQNPVVADFARMMDVAQKTGNFNLIPSRPNPTTQGNNDSSVDNMLVMLIREQQLTREQISSAVIELGKRPITFDMFAYDRKRADIDFVKQVTQG